MFYSAVESFNEQQKHGIVNNGTEHFRLWFAVPVNYEANYFQKSGGWKLFGIFTAKGEVKNLCRGCDSLKENEKTWKRLPDKKKNPELATFQARQYQGR